MQLQPYMYIIAYSKYDSYIHIKMLLFVVAKSYLFRLHFQVCRSVNVGQ